MATTLHEAAQQGNLKEIRRLLDNGDDVNAKDTQRKVPLHYASANGHGEIVELLLKAQGVDVNVADDQGRTALYGAASKGYREVVALLLEKGANINALDKYGKTPLHHASADGHAEIVKLLLNAQGIDVNVADNQGRTALHEAAINPTKKLLKIFREDNQDHTSSRIVAVGSSSTKVIEMLRKAGADVDAKDKDGNTPLDVNRSSGGKIPEELFLNKDADIEAINKEGNASPAPGMASDSLVLKPKKENAIKGGTIGAAAGAALALLVMGATIAALPYIGLAVVIGVALGALAGAFIEPTIKWQDKYNAEKENLPPPDRGR